MTRMGARPTEGSSIRRILGAVIRARASVSICCSPPLMLPASCRRRSASRGKVSKQNARFFAIAARALGRYAPSRRFSSTVSRGKSRRPSGTSAMPRSTICSGARPTRSCSTPSIVALMTPELGDTMPIMHFISELELSHVHLSQAAGHRVRTSGEAHLPEDAHRLLDDAALGQLFVPARGIEERHAQVVEHRHAGERLGDLKAAREAEADALVRGMPADVLAVEADAPFLVPERSGDAVDERALSRAVGPDQADPLAGPHYEVDSVERGKTAKSLGHATHFEQRSGHQRSFRRRQASTQPMMPFGASVTKSTSSTPTIRRFQAEDTVTCTSCCTVPSRIAPISAPIQRIRPATGGMSMLLTAYDRLNAELGSMYER